MVFRPIGLRTLYFNSRPHGGRPLVSLPLLSLLNISTHALTEGDIGISFQLAFCDISTHALTEGDNITNPSNPPIDISTHALTEGDA